MADVESKYRTLITAAPDAIFVLDMAAGSVVEVNTEAAELLGRGADEVVGLPIQALHPSGTYGLYRDRFEEAMSDDIVRFSTLAVESQAYMVDDDGDKVPVEIHARVVELDDGPHVLGVVRDISERLDHELALQQYATLVTHDLRNPLTIAQGTLEALSETGETEYYEKTAAALQRMEEIIDDLLTLAQERDDAFDVEAVSFEEVVMDVWGDAGGDHATFEFDALTRLVADRSRLFQILDNIVRNTARHGGDDVAVRIGILEDEFYVEDDGPSIPTKRSETVFEPGYNTGNGGTGFGLVVVEALVTSHGCEITVCEGTDGGARFEVRGVEFCE